MGDMRKPLFDLISQVDMQAEINSYKPGSGLAWPMLFPLRYTPSLNIKSLEGDEGIPVSADVIAFNSKAPQKTRKTVGAWSGNIAKVAISRVKTEEDVKEYNFLAAYAAENKENPNIVRQIVDMVFEDVEFCYDGVNYRTEDLALQIGSKAELALTMTKNNDVVTQETLNWNIPDEHKVGVTNKWSVPASSDPLKDIIDGANKIKKEGRNRPRYAIMDQVAFERLLMSEKTIKRVASVVLSATGLANEDSISLEMVNSYMRTKGYPQIAVLDSYVNQESRDGNQTVYKPWAENVVVLSPTLQLGWTWWSDVPMVEDTAALQAYRDNVKITRFSRLDPMEEVTLAEAYIMPALINRASLYYINTENSAWNNGNA